MKDAIDIIWKIIIWYLILLWDVNVFFSWYTKKGIAYFSFMYQGFIPAIIENGNIISIDWDNMSKDDIDEEIEKVKRSKEELRKKIKNNK
jgi:hypothetical protein